MTRLKDLNQSSNLVPAHTNSRRVNAVVQSLETTSKE
jgi:hypothetical protein